jgi:Tfp pilus assembly protein PilX
VQLELLSLVVIVVVAFLAGYGLRSYISHRRRHKWD